MHCVHMCTEDSAACLCESTLTSLGTFVQREVTAITDVLAVDSSSAISCLGDPGQVAKTPLCLLYHLYKST